MKETHSNIEFQIFILNDKKYPAAIKYVAAG
jgi:hypothetical protein